MVLKKQLPSYAEAKDDDGASSRASLSSTSVNTLNEEEPSTKLSHEVAHHPAADTSAIPESSPASGELPPSYEHATSTYSSSRYSSSQGPPSIAGGDSEAQSRSVHNAPPTAQPVAAVVNAVAHKSSPAGARDIYSSKKAKVHEGDFTLHSSETMTGPIVITGKLQVHSKARFIGPLEVRRSIKIHGTLTVDGPLVVGEDITNHGALHVSETAVVGEKLKNHGKVMFVQHVTHRGEISNHGTITYASEVDFRGADIKNHGVINAEHGAAGMGKVKNHGKINGFSSL